MNDVKCDCGADSVGLPHAKYCSTLAGRPCWPITNPMYIIELEDGNRVSPQQQDEAGIDDLIPGDHLAMGAPSLGWEYFVVTQVLLDGTAVVIEVDGP